MTPPKRGETLMPNHDLASWQSQREDRSAEVAESFMHAEFALARMETKQTHGNYGGVAGLTSLSGSVGQHGIVISERCHYCSKHKPPKDIITMSGGAKICERCYRWHHHALDVLAGTVPVACQECHLKYEELERRSPDGNVRFSVLPLNGIYAVVCKPCGDKIVRKRVDLFGDTAYGDKLHLKGTK